MLADALWDRHVVGQMRLSHCLESSSGFNSNHNLLPIQICQIILIQKASVMHFTVFVRMIFKIELQY